MACLAKEEEEEEGKAGLRAQRSLDLNTSATSDGGKRIEGSMHAKQQPC